MERTRQIQEVVIKDNILEKIKHVELFKEYRRESEKKYQEAEKFFFTKRWIAFSCEGECAYWNKDEEIIIPVKKSYPGGKVRKSNNEEKDREDNANQKENQDNQKLFGLNQIQINAEKMEALFGSKSDCPSEIRSGIMASKKFENEHWVGFQRGSYCLESGRFANWNDKDSIQVEMAGISKENFKENIRSQRYRIQEEIPFKKAVFLLKNREISDIEEEEVLSLMEVLGVDPKVIENKIEKKIQKDYTLTKDISDLYYDSLLSCDTFRADLERYDRKCLEDVNAGHWELWDAEQTKEEGQIKVKLEQPVTARNPEIDIHEGGLIGIDFGTKSTIVSEENGKEKTNLLRIGIGRLHKKAEKKHYENPTIMEFINLEKFLSDYKKRDGRPETSIDDLRVSGAADNDFQTCQDSDFFYSFFYDIKQWCGDTARNVKIVDQNKMERILPAFVDLKEGDVNPLEIYAYYLGLYINNMHNGIYLDYILSFPVTYELEVKEKIRQSFENGLKKSLPEVIIKNDEIMKKFRVRLGVSEPAAYAITALQQYGFEPEEGKEYLYGIFDFGGGTSDFDFGIWREADEKEQRRYDYVIDHFGAEGDKYLGGENLLEIMAYEVFKANADFMRNGGEKEDKSGQTAGFSFTMPPEQEKFPGSETLIKNSQQAKRNTKQLMEVLRPFWEGIVGIAEKGMKDSDVSSQKNVEQQGNEGEEKTVNSSGKIQKQENEAETIEYNGYLFQKSDTVQKIDKDGMIEVDLFDNNGELKSGQKLYVKNDAKKIHVNLIEILENRIRIGVNNFFASLVLAFGHRDKIENQIEGIHIFLAGNSSKSPILWKIFQERILEEQKEGKGLSGNCYELLPPLGTEKAYEIQRKRNISVDENDILAPTGKTGVAYGLIAGRAGGRIKVISEIKAEEQTKFRYNIGLSRKRKFSMVLDRNEAEYGKWEEFIDAGQEDFEIYYTSLPNAANMLVTDPYIHKVRCRISENEVNENANIYIRTIADAPEYIEYCVAEKEPGEDAKGQRVHLEE